MSEPEGQDTSAPEAPPQPAKRDHRTLIIAIAFGIGLATLIAFNMN